MFRRVRRWAVLSTAGLLVAGTIGLGVVNAQGPAPRANPSRGTEAQATCPALRRGLGWRWGWTVPQTINEALGMPPEELTAAIRDGKTVAGLAKEKGIAISDLVNKVLDAHQDALDQAIENGCLTEEQVEAMRARVQERLTQRLEDGTFGPGLGAGTGPMGRACRVARGRHNAK